MLCRVCIVASVEPLTYGIEGNVDVVDRWVSRLACDYDLFALVEPVEQGDDTILFHTVMNTLLYPHSIEGRITPSSDQTIAYGVCCFSIDTHSS